VYFYDLARPKNSCVNKLQVCLVFIYLSYLEHWLQGEEVMKPFTFLKGHGSPVIGVAWNHGENLLASSDSDGTVIVWKRAKSN
jgi:WD40 repeat protein